MPSSDLPPPAPGRRATTSLSVARPLVAFLSGVIVVPAGLFILFSLLFPNEVMAYGNGSFWCAVLIGGAASAGLAMVARRLPLWLLFLLGPVLVLCAVVLWLCWIAMSGMH